MSTHTKEHAIVAEIVTIEEVAVRFVRKAWTETWCCR